MSNKLFFAVVTVLVAGAAGLVIRANRSTPLLERPGVAHADDGRKHVESKQYGGEAPPTSGDHAAPLPWQAFSQDVPDANAIHNLEHGGIYVSYRPDVPPEEVAKLRALFFTPFARPSFTPSKVVMAPRAANQAPIVLSSWTRSQTFEAYDEVGMMEYYLRNVGKSPEAGAS